MTQAQFSDQVQAIHNRVRHLYQQFGPLAYQNEAVASAMEELSVALDALRLAEVALETQQDEYRHTFAEIEQSYKRYYDLFCEAPVAYSVTSVDGNIRQVNQEASRLLGADERMLIGRSLGNFIPSGQRRMFRAVLSTIQQHDQPQMWCQLIQPSQGAPIEVTLIANIIRGQSGQAQGIRWLIIDTSLTSRAPLLEREVNGYTANHYQ